MTDKPVIAYVLVDWGTSHLRIWAVDGDGAVHAEAKSAQGMGATASSAFEGILDQHLADLGIGADVPVIMCGMVGSRQGWQEAPYLEVPAALDAVVDNAVRVSGIKRDARILPGIADRRVETTDVMRSEETQLLGLAACGRNGSDLVCMPGTHSKWVSLSNDGRTVTRFSTSLSGDLFAALSQHSVLRHSVSGAGDMELEAFDQASQRALSHPAQALMDMFAVRARMLVTGLGAGAARSTLSGIVIGHDIAGAIDRFGKPQRIMLVGGGMQGQLYARVLQSAGIGVADVDGEELSRLGLFTAARHIWPHRINSSEPTYAAASQS